MDGWMEGYLGGWMDGWVGSGFFLTTAGGDLRDPPTKILLPSAVHLEERLTVSQSVS